jgi:hypothetical protein
MDAAEAKDDDYHDVIVGNTDTVAIPLAGRRTSDRTGI